MFSSSQAAEEGDREVARRRAESRYAFRLHAAIFTAVNFLLIVIWYFSGVAFPWFLFPLGGWGLGLAAHLFQAYGNHESDWVERETDRILSEERRRQALQS